jgi:hypothetical protein
MPVARIYASLVEESEPLCADLLARGYDVEVVFPDAVLPTPADLELRVERCSAEQAIARVEAAGSPSRCVFVTPAKGPRRELLLVEMTVLSTGTEGRHPLMLPALAIVTDNAVSIPRKSVELLQDSGALATVLPFPVVAQEPLSGDALPINEPVLERDVDIAIEEHPQLPHREIEKNFSKSEIAALNDFLAHAPSVDRQVMLPAKILESLRHSNLFARARKHWESLSLLGVACCFFLLLSIGWSAAPAHSRANVVLPVMTPALAVPKVTAPESVLPPASLAVKRETNPVALAIPMQGRARVQHVRNRRVSVAGDQLIAQDRIVRSGSGFLSQPHSQPVPARLIQPRLIQPAAIKSDMNKPTAIKKITDLK